MTDEELKTMKQWLKGCPSPPTWRAKEKYWYALTDVCYLLFKARVYRKSAIQRVEAIEKKKNASKIISRTQRKSAGKS